MQTEAVPQTSLQHYFLHRKHVQSINKKERRKKKKLDARDLSLSRHCSDSPTKLLLQNPEVC